MLCRFPVVEKPAHVNIEEWQLYLVYGKKNNLVCWGYGLCNVLQSPIQWLIKLALIWLKLHEYDEDATPLLENLDPQRVDRSFSQYWKARRQTQKPRQSVPLRKE